MRQALTEALVDYQGSLVVVSHDRHLLRNTVEEFYLVHNKKVEPFSGDLEDYQKWLNDLNRTPDLKVETEVNVDAVNSNANRKAQKRREAELRQQTAPLRKKLQQYETQIDELSCRLCEIEMQLGDSDLYLAENKEKMTALLTEQVNLKKQLELVEMEWLNVQEALEIILN